jgi:hypothetical protein
MEYPHTLKELKQHAKLKGLKGYSRMNKTELLTMIYGGPKPITLFDATELANMVFNRVIDVLILYKLQDVVVAFQSNDIAVIFNNSMPDLMKYQVVDLFTKRLFNRRSVWKGCENGDIYTLSARRPYSYGQNFFGMVKVCMDTSKVHVKTEMMTFAFDFGVGGLIKDSVSILTNI